MGHPQYLPPNLATEATLALGNDLGVTDPNGHWTVLRLLEEAYSTGYRDGHRRAIGDESLRLAAEKQRNRNLATAAERDQATMPVAALCAVDDCIERVARGAMYCEKHEAGE